jgi:hypothetical protein
MDPDLSRWGLVREPALAGPAMRARRADLADQCAEAPSHECGRGSGGARRDDHGRTRRDNIAAGVRARCRLERRPFGDGRPIVESPTGTTRRASTWPGGMDKVAAGEILG